MSTKQAKSNAQFDKVAEQALELMLQKFEDYGSSWTILRPRSILEQIIIKIRRVRNIQEIGKRQVEDSLDGDIFGALNYSAMALSLLRGDIINSSDLTKDKFQSYMEKSFARARDLFQKKNHDYGEAWRDLSISSMIDLMLMKTVRLSSMSKNDWETIVSEGADANYLDIMNYAIFCLIRIEEGTNPMD